MQSLVSRLFEALEVGTVELTTGTLRNRDPSVPSVKERLRSRNVEPVRPTTETTSSDFRHFIEGKRRYCHGRDHYKGGVLHIVSSMKPTSTIPKSAGL